MKGYESKLNLSGYENEKFMKMIGLWLKRLIAYWCGIELILLHFFKPFSEIVWPSTEMLRHSKAYTTPLPMAEKRKLAGIYHPAHHNGQVIGSLLEDKQTGTNLYCRRKQLSLYNPHSSLFDLIFTIYLLSFQFTLIFLFICPYPR